MISEKLNENAGQLEPISGEYVKYAGSLYFIKIMPENFISDEVKIFDDQESSNILNIIKSNILVYYDHSEYIKYININD